ncbi:MAG: hypothetical protein AB7U61_09675 [Methylocystis sp.]
MRKFVRSYILIALTAITSSGACAGELPDFKVCQSTYALCTTARCAPVSRAKGVLSCACDVKTGYSLGLEACRDPTETNEGVQIKSRYFPVKSYAVCANARPWAFCLDKPCVIDKSDPTKASCTCESVKRQGPYVIVTDAYTPKTCKSGIISSATVTQITQATDFLKNSAELKPFDIKVLNSAK